jgi:hypothetical protein
VILLVVPVPDCFDVAKEVRHRLRYFRHIIKHGCKLNAQMLRTAVDADWWGIPRPKCLQADHISGV